jgi:hypothetical protein
MVAVRVDQHFQLSPTLFSQCLEEFFAICNRNCMLLCQCCNVRLVSLFNRCPSLLEVSLEKRAALLLSLDSIVEVLHSLSSSLIVALRLARSFLGLLRVLLLDVEYHVESIVPDFQLRDLSLKSNVRGGKIYNCCVFFLGLESVQYPKFDASCILDATKVLAEFVEVRIDRSLKEYSCLLLDIIDVSCTWCVHDSSILAPVAWAQ